MKTGSESNFAVSEDLLQLEHKTITENWMQILQVEFRKPYFASLKKFLQAEKAAGKKIYPPEEDIYSWTRLCSPDAVKVVILGQDPYHGPNQAHGLCFSVKPGIPAPPSLKNIYKELSQEYGSGFSIPKHGNLVGWARQGVLLLNTVLTVRASEAFSHKDKGWERFTDSVIDYLNRERKNIVFILWGSAAQKKGSKIDQKKHMVIKGVHPSPLSAMRGFFGCGHFEQANTYLQSHDKPVIDWNDLKESY